MAAAPHTLPVGAVINSSQRSPHRGDLTRDEASDQIAEKYLRLVKVYEEAAASVSA